MRSRFVDDTRGRVPFALIGILLLVGSITFAGGLVTRPAPQVNENVERSMRSVTAGSHTALREAVQKAGRAAAARPLIHPANTTAGRIINDASPFRDYLRLRIYLAARQRLRSVAAHVGDVRATASLRTTPNAAALRRAKRRVHIEPVGKPTEAGLRVRIENVSLRATRHGVTVASTSKEMTLVVATPVLALHERVQRFEHRLNSGPLHPGLGRRLTARLYAVTWARGYAQYGGAPIANVLGNRHIELMTNGAILEEQRKSFGVSDPRGRRSLRRATARVGLTDLLVPTTQHGEMWTDFILGTADAATGGNGDFRTIPAPKNSTYSPEMGTKIGVNRSAERALLSLIDGGESSKLESAIASAYHVSVRPVTTVRTIHNERKPSPHSPGKNWTLQYQRMKTRTVAETTDASSPSLGTPNGWHLLWTGTRHVVQQHTVIRQWKRRDGSSGWQRNHRTNRITRTNQTTTTTRHWTDEFVVSLGIAGDHRTTNRAPVRPLPTAHEPDGPFSGPNLADVRGKAKTQLVTDRGGASELARHAVSGTLNTRPVTIQGRYPHQLRSWAYRDVRTLRNRVRNLSVTVSRGNLAAGKTNPAAKLATKLRAHRSELIDAPSSYDSAAERARYAVRATYLDAVIDRLESRADRTRKEQKGFGKAVLDATGLPLDRIQRILDARTKVTSPSRHPLPTAGPGESVNLSVDGAPPYLTLSAVEHRQVSAVPKGATAYPLAARNINLFTVPSGDISDTILSFLPDGRKPKRVSIRSAGFALRAANETLAGGENASLRRRRDELQRNLAASLDDIERRLGTKLANGDSVDLSSSESHAAIRRGMAHWKTTADRTIAVVNGSAAKRIGWAIERAKGGRRWTSVQRDAVTFRVRFGLESARKNTDGVKESAVKPVAKTARTVLTDKLKGAAQERIEKGVTRRVNKTLNEEMANMPAGLPVTPIPGYWYATVNVWQVDVSGTYAQFTVRARDGPPTSPGASVAYSRQAGTVRLDIDDDGTEETLGRTAPVSFDTGTTVIVAVPPGKTGVGDVDGNADERSPGWANRSNNPFDAASPRDDHALRRDRRPRRDDSDESTRRVSGGTRGDDFLGRSRRRGRSDRTRP